MAAGTPVRQITLRRTVRYPRASSVAWSTLPGPFRWRRRSSPTRRISLWTGRPVERCSHRLHWRGDQPRRRTATSTGWVLRQPAGNRNKALFWAACRALEKRYADPSPLVAAAIAAGLSERETARTIRSACKEAARVDQPRACVRGDLILDDVHDQLTKYCVLPYEHAYIAVTVWIAATHAQTAWEHATRCVIKSPLKRCGKTRLLEVLTELSYNPLPTSNISVAALVHGISEQDPPTLVLDEARCNRREAARRPFRERRSLARDHQHRIRHRFPVSSLRRGEPFESRKFNVLHGRH